jgi:hypothetical protein
MKIIPLPNLQILLGIGEWKIGYKMVGIVKDGAGNNVSTVHLCKWHHTPCHAHTLDLIVQRNITYEK